MNQLKNLEIDDAMLRRAHGDIVNRAITGCYIYLLIWFAIIIPEKLYVTAPELSLWFTLVFIASAAARVSLLFSFKKIYARYPFLWRPLFYPVLCLPALCWGVLCALSFAMPALKPVSFLIIISTGGLAGGGVLALIPSRILTISFISCLLGPSIVMFIINKDYNLSITLVFAFYWVGMVAITRTYYREYWLGLNYASVIKKHTFELERLNSIDGLTGLKNRAFFDEALSREIKTAIRSQTSVALLLLDLDRFKSVNDRYGHLVGDECLRRLADLLQHLVQRETDVVARYGGEEFAIILPDTDKEEAIAMAERIRLSVEDLDTVYGEMTIAFTVSIGVASRIPHPGYAAVQFIEQADSALYRAKNSGRNKVMS